MTEFAGSGKELSMRLFVLAALFVLASVSLARGADLPRYELSVDIRPGEGLLIGTARISLPEGWKGAVHVGQLPVLSSTLGGSDVAENIKDGKLEASGAGELIIRYEGRYEGRFGAEAVTGGASEIPANVIGEQGASLTGHWYPSLEALESGEGLSYFSLRAALPEGYVAVSEAEEIEEAKTPQGVEFSFRFPHPVEGISLAAGKYSVKRRTTTGGTGLYGYFFAEDAGLAEKYLEYAERYIDLYEAFLGPFPYRRFSVVENFLPTGLSMPTFTLLGSSVARLPFIVETSLGHEVLHQWFGGSVYVDYEKGNWSEGLTTYLSDHLYDEQKGRGAEHRKGFLLGYRNYVNPANEFPLSEFRRRTDFASRSIGYGKAAMVFHMLREEMGDEAFFEALRKLIEEKTFRRASWEDIRKACEAASVPPGGDLGWFFDQWVTRTGAPHIGVREARALYLKGSHRVSFTLIQKPAAFRFTLPVAVMTQGGRSDHRLQVEGPKETFELEVPGLPEKLFIDGKYDLMRALEKNEAPPVLSALMGSEQRLVVTPSEPDGTYEALLGFAEAQGFANKTEDETKDEDLGAGSVLLPGLEGPVHERLFGRLADRQREGPTGLLEWLSRDAGAGRECFSLAVVENPLADSSATGVVAVAYASSAREAALAVPKLIHYGTYSYLRFEGGRLAEKAVTPAGEGLTENLALEMAAIEPDRTLGLDDVIREVLQREIVYVGEGHENYQDHKVQLEVIRAMQEAGTPFAIGMEMFQKPFQEPLDEYIAGRSTEKDLLLDSEYFKRWRFNYHLYREILEFARAHGIPVVALNARQEIVRKVSEGGLDSLSAEEREEIPRDMDLSDAGYRERLERVFREHKTKKSFLNFYQAQIVWDETMAHSIEEYLRENPGHRMVVLAGAGHVVYGSGIPKRAYRLGGRSYATIVTAANVPPEPGVADYVLFVKPLPAPASPLLGVALETEDERLLIKEVSPASAAEKAGLKKGDVLVSADGLEIKGFAELKAALFDKKPGDLMTLRVFRKRVFARDRELELIVEFPGSN